MRCHHCVRSLRSQVLKIKSQGRCRSGEIVEILSALDEVSFPRIVHFEERLRLCSECVQSTVLPAMLIEFSQ